VLCILPDIRQVSVKRPATELILQDLIAGSTYKVRVMSSSASANSTYTDFYSASTATQTGINYLASIIYSQDLRLLLWLYGTSGHRHTLLLNVSSSLTVVVYRKFAGVIFTFLSSLHRVFRCICFWPFFLKRKKCNPMLCPSFLSLGLSAVVRRQLWVLYFFTYGHFKIFSHIISCLTDPVLYA
jgi:hypothetical protein